MIYYLFLALMFNNNHNNQNDRSNFFVIKIIKKIIHINIWTSLPRKIRSKALFPNFCHLFVGAGVYPYLVFEIKTGQ